MWPMSQRQVTAMTVDDFETALVSADPDVTKWTGTGNGNYTVWSPANLTEGLDSDDGREEDDQRIHVDRFTMVDPDAIVASITAIFQSNFVPFEYESMFEKDTGYIHHSWTCILTNA